jgi:predicted ABC-type ATPase
MRESQHPILVLVAGPNGSGKTSLTTKILQHQWLDGCVYINPDNIARDRFGDWNSPDAVMKAARFAEEQRQPA